MATGIDCATPLTAKTAAGIKAAGYDFAGRYLVPPETYWKAITRAEAELIAAAGLRLLTVWETTADRVKGGAVAGGYDGRRAFERARELDMPTDGIIYFAVDYEAQAGDMKTIAEYLQAARLHTGPYRIGVYGSYSVVEAMHDYGVCEGFWQCLAWSYGRLSEHRTVYQHGFNQYVAGVNVDINDCPDMDAAGIWTYGEQESWAGGLPPAETISVPDAGGKPPAHQTPQRYNRVDELPDWARDDIVKLIDRGVLRGNGGDRDEDGRPADLDLSLDMVRLLVMHERETEQTVFPAAGGEDANKADEEIFPAGGGEGNYEEDDLK